ncbi:hypothetical protein [Mycobacterium marinum]|uniref:hypothetical protein n=1 Tax=Mycobacterium marinum TaxID=1781 RepID=UPI003562B1A9
MAKKRIEGDMPCDAGFLVLPECLDQSYESRMGGCYQISIRLPRFDRGVHTYNLIAPYTNSRFQAAQDEQDAAEARDAGDSQWGCMQDWSDPKTPEGWETSEFPPKSFLVEQLRFTTEGAADNDNELQHTRFHIRDHHAAWWSVLADWIGVISNQDLIELGKQRRRSLGLFSMWSTDPEDGQEPGFNSLRMPELRPYVGEPLTRAQLERCMALAGEATRPPEAWLMLRDARSLLNSGEFRRAVLDAGTAAEIALTAALDRYLAANSSADVAEALMDRSKMLQPLKNLAKDLDVAALPERFQQRLIEPRNKAVHSGKEMTKDVAEMAVSTTSELLHTTRPLSDFGFPTV